MIQIKKNEWAQPSQIREEVVQTICDTFIKGRSFQIAGHYETRFVKKDGLGFYHMWEVMAHPEEFVKINGAEMKAAFRELIKSGYFMFYGYDCRHPVYKCFNRPVMDGYTRVSEFTDFID